METSNKVELIDWYGGDKAVARAAWTSTQIDVESKSEERIRDLIVNRLREPNSGKLHKTPFERAIVEFNVTCDVASHIHLIKHRHANINGESARYKELKDDKYLLPQDWDIVYGQTRLHGGTDWSQELENYTKKGNELYHQCLEELSITLGRKRAKESARFFKTYNSQITLSVMMNMSCFQNFYSLRADDSAQLEIREIAQQMLQLIKDIPGGPFKYTLEAFGFKG